MAVERERCKISTAERSSPISALKTKTGDRLASRFALAKVRPDCINQQQDRHPVHFYVPGGDMNAANLLPSRLGASTIRGGERGTNTWPNLQSWRPLKPSRASGRNI